MSLLEIKMKVSIGLKLPHSSITNVCLVESIFK